MNDLYNRLEFDKICERVASRAAFSLGKKRVLESEPSFSRLNTQRELTRLRSAMDLLIKFGPLSFGGIRDITPHLIRASKGGVLSIEEIVFTGRFMQGSQRLKKQFQSLEESFEPLEDLFESIVINQHLLNHIDHCFSETSEVLDRASDTLRDVRKEIAQKKQSLEAKTQEFLSKNKDILAEPVVTLHQGRRTFLIRNSDKNKFDGTVYGYSASGQSVYFEPQSIARLHADLMGAYAKEKEEIDRICKETSHAIGQDADQLIADLNTCGMIDELFAKADWGRIHDGCVARLSDDTLNIIKARHPLIDDKEVVANTYTLKPPYRTVIISGPNTGGKSVSLKTMGLSVLMTLCGFPILAQEAEVMFVDQIFVDIGDQQSIEKSLSSFSAHLETMKIVCEKATPRSLVLLDELGSQTDPLEGESLSMAILDYFRHVGCFVIATTHFSKLKQYGTKHDDILIASVAFDMDTLSPTYRYREHVMGESNALSIAKRLGLNETIVNQAWEYKKESTQEADQLLELLETRIKMYDDMSVELQAQKDAFEHEKVTLEKTVEQTLERVQKEKRQWLDEKNAAFDQQLEALKQQIEILNKTASKPQERKAVLETIEKAKPKIVVEPVGVGDRVKIATTGQVGILEKIEKTTAYVAVGSLTLQVDVNKLDRLAGPVKKKKAKQKSHSVSRITPQKTELNIIGKRVAEAMPEVEQFVDSCILNRVNTFRIVHGHGSGTLRKAVHEYLRRNKNIASFELAAVNEGGTGATKVVLKQ